LSCGSSSGRADPEQEVEVLDHFAGSNEELRVSFRLLQLRAEKPCYEDLAGVEIRPLLFNEKNLREATFANWRASVDLRLTADQSCP
jgi:hypothetical protein